MYRRVNDGIHRRVVMSPLTTLIIALLSFQASLPLFLRPYSHVLRLLDNCLMPCEYLFLFANHFLNKLQRRMGVPMVPILQDVLEFPLDHNPLSNAAL